jgi:hypothetical protein
MLGRLEMDIDECIKCYVDMMDSVFQKVQHRFSAKGRLQGRYDSERLTSCIKEIILRRGLRSESRLRAEDDPACKVWVSIQSTTAPPTFPLSLYLKNISCVFTISPECK